MKRVPMRACSPLPSRSSSFTSRIVTFPAAASILLLLLLAASDGGVVGAAASADDYSALLRASRLGRSASSGSFALLAFATPPRQASAVGARRGSRNDGGERRVRCRRGGSVRLRRVGARAVDARVDNGPPPTRGMLSASVAAAAAAKAEGEGKREYDIETLSDDPKVYVVNNLLSPEECREYIDRASSLSSSSDDDDESDGQRVMTRSNAPEVSLDVSRLWPLPFLCLGAGIPPVIRLFENLPEEGTTTTVGGGSPSFDSILSAALPPIGVAVAITALLAWGITQYVRQEAASSSRTSEAVSFNTDSDVEFIRPLMDRICSHSVSGGHPWMSFEAPVVTRYRPGAIFAKHNDASPTRGSEWSDLGGQRIVTVICYLNDCSQGGGTYFDRLGITVQPKTGSALVFFPADKETLAADDRTRHESLTAVEEKWIVQLFGRVGERVPPPLGIPDSFGERSTMM